MFEVVKRNGLARVGKWLIEEQNAEVTTPNIVFIENEGIKAFDEAEILLSKKELTSEKPFIVGSESLFFGNEKNITNYTVSPHLIYPPSQEELNRYAALVNKENLSSRIFVVTGKEEAVSETVKNVDGEVYVLSNALHLVQKPDSFVKTIVNLRKGVGYQKLIYTPGLGNPNHIALLVYLGIDLFDSVSFILNARKGIFLTPLGKLNRNIMEEKFCFCPSCIHGKGDFDSILLHNYFASISELKLIRNAIRGGQLRELVESRVRTEPLMVAIMRTFDSNYYLFQEKYLPVSGGTLIAASNDSLFRPEIVRFRERVKERYKKPSHKKILLFLPCSARKPYSFSKTHKAIGKTLSQCGNRSVVHEVVITSPLGVVPIEVELFYPAQQYDIPVARTWSKDEKSMIGEGIIEFLKINSYDSIVVHLPPDYEFVFDFLDDYINTCGDNPTSNQSLDKLGNVLSGLVGPYEKIDRETLSRENMMCFAQFQFKNAGEALIKDAIIKGRYPNLRIFKDGKQIGMLVGKRGLISLTIEGGKILSEKNAYWVKIHDFTPKGNIFAVGVKDADENIRIGDDVIVQKDDELVGVGVAQMNPEEMVKSDRGEAVRIRHLVKSEGEMA